MLTIRDLTVRLGGRTILDGASASLPPGSRVRLQVKRIDTVMMELDTRFVAQLEKAETAVPAEDTGEAVEG